MRERSASRDPDDQLINAKLKRPKPIYSLVSEISDAGRSPGRTHANSIGVNNERDKLGIGRTV